LVELFDRHAVSFVSITQSFNTPPAWAADPQYAGRRVPLPTCLFTAHVLHLRLTSHVLHLSASDVITVTQKKARRTKLHEAYKRSLWGVAARTSNTRRVPAHRGRAVDVVVEKYKWGLVLDHSDNSAGQYRNLRVDTSANAATPDKLLEKMLGGADGPAAPFGLIRGERRMARSASLKLERHLASRLRDRAATFSISMESLVCLAWSLVLVRFCGQDSVTFGAALPPFTKTVPMRIDAATRAAETAAQETHELFNQIRNFLPIWGALLPEGDPGAAYSLSALFGYGLPEEHVWAGELSGGAWPLAVIASEREETLLISAWAQDPADPATVCAYMRTALERLAGTLETAPDTLTASVDVMPEEERHKLIIEWNATGAAYPRDKCIHHFIEEQVTRTPDAVAVIDSERTLTYSQLNVQANRLAHHLRGLGVGPDVLVAICFERSPELVIGLLAILKAGGAYVPVDPEYPRERLADMLKDSAPAAVLTQTHVRDILPAGSDSLPVIAIDSDAPLWAGMPGSNPDCAGLSADNLAYVIYTSGSTGMPKGAVNAHMGVVNRLLWMQDAYHLTADDAVLQKTPFSFDVSVWEFFWPLLTGARLAMARPGGHKDPAYLCDAIQQKNITTLHFVPSMLQAFLEYEGASSCRSVKRVFCSGEALPATLARRFRERFPCCELHNLYGPTEAAVDVTAWKCGAGTEAASIPIGRPIANTRIYILGARGQPVPVGVAGEVFIGGVQVGRGYLNRPDLTAERFVADPFTADSGARMYKTGDLGRWTPDGIIEYLGRNDFQVKIRGFRIELGEIETRLAEHEGVREPVVLAREDSSGDKRLVAYYVSDVDIALEALRAHLLAKLPEYMVPAAYVRLDRMPLSKNGKLERKALPAPDSSAYVQDAYEAPAGPVEEKLAQIWASVLGLERISRNANFFDLGGHSLLAVRTLMLIEAEFGHSLNLTSLFRAPSIASLSLLLQQGGRPSIRSPYVSIQPDGTKPPLFSIVTPTRYLNIARHLGKAQPVIGLLLFDPAKPPEMKYSCLEDVAGECVRLIREIQPKGPYAVIGFCAAGVVAFETAQQLVQMGHEVSFIGIIDGWAPDYVRRRGGDAWLKATDFASFCKRVYAKIRSGQKSVKSLVIEPITLLMKHLKRLRHAPSADTNLVSFGPEMEMIEQFEREMWEYLSRLQSAYKPKPFHGRVHSFVSQDRPTGWLADSSLGWGRLATEGAEVVTYQGGHWSLFEEPAAGQAAGIITAALETWSARAPSKAPSGSATVRPNGQFTSADPLVSIVIPAYNAEKDIAQAIRCVISQTYPELEIIVVDDGSQDGSVQTARKLLKSSFKGRWSVLELGVNRGASAARNVAVKQAKGEWIQFLDSDDTIAADKIEAQMKCALTAGPDVSVIYSSWRHVYLEDGKFVPAGPVNTQRYEGKHPLMFCMYYSPLHHGACLIRRSALERVQGFNETMRSYEDADLLVRLAKETGRFQFAASNRPSYLWRLYKEQAREGGENTRYRLEDTAMNWVRVVKEAAGNQQIGDILSSPDNMIMWGLHCASYARRLYESEPEAFKLFMHELRSVDPDFTYP
jgi:amino acid adenylation domain-containing protein